MQLDDTKDLYFISDTHFHHKNVIKYCNRPFTDVEEMNSIIINNWNKTITDNDQVVFLGDFMMGFPNKLFEAESKNIYNQLNGIKYFIKGNHDFRKPFTKEISFQEKNITPVLYRNHVLILAHDPDHLRHIHNPNAYYIHGHIHNNKYNNINTNKSKFYNVSVEVIGYTPIKFENLIGAKNGNHNNHGSRP